MLNDSPNTCSLRIYIGFRYILLLPLQKVLLLFILHVPTSPASLSAHYSTPSHDMSSYTSPYPHPPSHHTSSTWYSGGTSAHASGAYTPFIYTTPTPCTYSTGSISISTSIFIPISTSIFIPISTSIFIPISTSIFIGTGTVSIGTSPSVSYPYLYPYKYKYPHSCSNQQLWSPE
ncbi:hypothetical protein P167DRAFT_140539 [Morchella conica CCBAS932]|uniref:Uncharacterized protein n=1 Tax=Morchella conica CCBAS932 TaxID=1392247 RepID=A0A3N4KUC2_9PEZI|nr:hypothetical protein P167DRAFT_140539 [Morchella conica CCBAS932]